MPKIVSTKILYSGWLSLILSRVRFANGEEADRHIVLLGRAVAVLPYDAERRVALVVSMPRAPVIRAGQDDIYEAIAGKLDSDDPAECARREAMEEAGVRLGGLQHIGAFWPTPSTSTEIIDYYLAPYAITDRIGSGGGLDEENEHITVHELSLAELWTAYRQQRLPDGKLVTLLLALKADAPQLFSA